MTIKDLQIGQTARIDEVGGEGALRQHFLDMGVIPGAEVTLVKLAPMGDPMELSIHGYELTLRLEDAGQIKATPVERKTEFVNKINKTKHDINHPGLGEEGKYHTKGDGTPLPKGEKLTFALVGNQNSGKTTLFNQLTGSNQHVGNFPGVTVDRKDGVIRGKDFTCITIFQAYIPCHLIPARNWLAVILYFMKSQRLLSTLLMPQTSNEICI